ncbi:thermosome subunit [Candidatus Woesearchaeota archaeon]|nr:MAG: thermosome subunit [Candidatus Woesearchaeota archaeon]
MSDQNILPENVQRYQGRIAQRNNILAAKLVAETIRTTLGPKGMDKMLVDPAGEVTITNDGVTILKEMHIEHPAAKMIVDIAKTQEEEVGDGTTSAVILAGELLKQAEYLLEKDVHPTLIARGYRMAFETALKILHNLSEPLKKKDLEVIAATAMTGKGAEADKEHLATLIIRAIDLIKSQGDVSRKDIKVETIVGKTVGNSELIEGIVLDKERVHAEMPKKVENPLIALIDAPLEIKNTEIDAKINITSPEQMQQFLDMEERMLANMVAKIKATGASVVLCQKGIDDLAQHFLAREGIYAVRRIKKSDMERLAKATGARIVHNLSDLSSADLGTAGVVFEKTVGDEEMTFISGCKRARAVTLLVHGPTEHIAHEAKRAVEDSIGDVLSALESGRVVAGAGSCEMELSRNLIHFSQQFSGREQLAIKAFAEAIEIIPRTLAESAGSDPLDIMTKLKAAHEKGQKWAGINVFTGTIMDAYKKGVIEPLKIKTQAISSAAQVAIMILRIDDVIAAGAQEQNAQMPEGM